MVTTSMNRDHTKFEPVTVRRYVRAGYRLAGTHSGVQICRWARAALTGRRLCYKRWYGIRSHRCIQLTPALQFCNLRCVFCWRFHTPGRFKAEHAWDPPDLILDEAIAAQRRLLSGFKANPRVAGKLFEESMNPIHVAISLDGEPTLYPMIADLIREINHRGMTSFLVTNGTMPSRLEDILNSGVEPTNLYLSLYGPDKMTYEEVTQPLIPDFWERIRASIRLMQEFRHSQTIARLTLVKGINMHDPEGYSKLVDQGDPCAIELKGYSWLGESKHRLSINAMPYQFEIRQFAKRMQDMTKYQVVAEDPVSRVVLLTQDGSVSGLFLDSQ